MVEAELDAPESDAPERHAGQAQGQAGSRRHHKIAMQKERESASSWKSRTRLQEPVMQRLATSKAG